MVLVIPDDWTDGIDSILRQFPNSGKIVVVGCKGSGKSTFVRTLSDSYLKSSIGSSSTVVLDTDSGQPDKTPPGTIALYVKSVSVKDPLKMLHRVVNQRFLGFVNPANDPFAYTAKVNEVFQDYASNAIAYSGMPLIVNCHGWGTGCGRETWETVISIVQPDIVVYIGPGDFSIGATIPNAFSAHLGLPQVTIPSQLNLSKVIVVDQSEENSSDKRWVKIARHFRPDLTEFVASDPFAFFKLPFVRKLVLPLADVCIEFVAIDSVAAVDVICKTIVGVTDSQTGICLSLGYVYDIDESKIVLFVPPNLPLLPDSITLVRSRELNWSPRDSVSQNGKRTLVNFATQPQPFFLPHVLGGAGAKVASGRTNLKRIKHHK